MRSNRRWGRRTRRHVRRRALLLLATIAVVALGVAGAVLIRDAVTAQRALAAAEQEVARSRALLRDGDVAAVQRSLARARSRLDEAVLRTTRLLWRSGERVPVLGDSLKVGRSAVELADAAAQVGTDLLEQAGDLVVNGRLNVPVQDGRVALGPLQAASIDVGRVDTRRLERSIDELAATTWRWVPDEVSEGRRRALTLGRELHDGVAAVREALALLPPLFGADEPRRYFLAMQNSAELRGTGGLIGFHAVLTVDRGRFRLSEPQVRDAFGEGDARIEGRFDPVPTTADFHRRYAQANAAGFLSNINLDPDLPTVAPVLLDFYEERTGVRLDGVVTADPTAMATILAAIGPVDVPDVAGGGLPDPLRPAELPTVVMVDAYDVLGGDSAARREYLRAVAVTVFERILSGDWDPGRVLGRVAEATGSGHLQLFSDHPAEQVRLEALGVAGRWAPPDEPALDALGVSANNVAANKSDVHVGHRLAGEITLAGGVGDARRLAELTVTVESDLPTEGHDLYVIGSAPISTTVPSGPIGPLGLNRTWFTMWAPEATTFVRGHGPDGQELDLVETSIHGQRAVDVVLETPSREIRSFSVALAGSVELSRDGADALYRLRLLRQAKAIPDRLDLRLTCMPGTRAAEVTLSGGGDGRGLGPHGQVGPALTGTIGPDGIASVTGDVSAPVEIELRCTSDR